MPVSRSSSSVHGRRLRAGLVLTGGALAVLALAGCGAQTTPAPTPSATDAPSATPGQGAKPAPSPTSAPDAAGTPVALNCAQVLTADDVYAFNPNFGTDPSYKPTGTPAKKTVSYKGVACGWLNQTSGDKVEISVAEPNAALATELKNKAVTDSNIVPTYGTPPAVEGYFAAAGGSGQAQVFTGKYWVVASSADFLEPGDAQQLVAAVLTHLPAA